MLSVVVFMILAVVLAMAVLAFTAFHDRRRELPRAPWLSEAVARTADALPVLATPDPPRSDTTAGRRS